MATLTSAERMRNERNMVVLLKIAIVLLATFVIGYIVRGIDNCLINNPDVVIFWTITAPMAVAGSWSLAKIIRLENIKDF